MNNNIDKQYQQLLKDIIEYGVEKQDRTGTGTKSIFGYTIRHNMKDGFPLLTTKKIHWPSIVSELLWFLKGDTNIKWLLEQGNTIWVGDAYKNYLKQYEKDKKHGVKYEDNPEYDRPFDQEEFINWIKNVDGFAKIYGELGPIYGATWRKWGRKGKYVVNEDLNFSNGTFTEIDQISNLINDLKRNPDSRRLMVNAWNVGELDQMVLPPCHFSWQIFTKELSINERVNLFMQGKKVDRFLEKITAKDLDEANIPTRAISLMWNQRSVDVGLGLGFNIASYALLLEILAKITNMVPDQLIGSLGDTHLYNDHIELVKEQIDREPFELPTLKIEKTNEFWNGFDVSMFGHLDINDFTLENYAYHPSIKLPLSN
jgi:thymidylate synthase